MNKNSPLISVIMSTYNSSKTLNKAVESILFQSYENLELLIMDDCSTDDTMNILKSFQEKDSRIKIYKNSKNSGLTKSLNILINKSKGEIIARQDSDDISDKDRLLKQLLFMRRKECHIVSSRARVINSNRKIPRYSFFIPKKLVMKYKNPFIHGTLFIQKETLKSVGCYDENFYFAQDYKLMRDLISKDYKIGFIKEPLYLLNLENNISQLYKEEQGYYASCVKKNKLPDLRK